MTIRDALKELRRRLGITQQALAVRAGLSVRGYAGYEGGDRHPEPGPLAALASIAAEAGHGDLANVLTADMLRQLRLNERETCFGRFDYATETVVDEANRFEYKVPVGPPRGMLLIVRHGREEVTYMEAVLKAFVGLRSNDAQWHERARAALEQLSQAMGVEK